MLTYEEKVLGSQKVYSSYLKFDDHFGTFKVYDPQDAEIDISECWLDDTMVGVESQLTIVLQEIKDIFILDNLWDRFPVFAYVYGTQQELENELLKGVFSSVRWKISHQGIPRSLRDDLLRHMTVYFLQEFGNCNHDFNLDFYFEIRNELLVDGYLRDDIDTEELVSFAYRKVVEWGELDPENRLPEPHLSYDSDGNVV